MQSEAVRHARRLLVAAAGFILLGAGAVMLITPGPGWILIFLGLSVLSVEFVWARRLRSTVMVKARQYRARLARLWRRLTARLG